VASGTTLSNTGIMIVSSGGSPSGTVVLNTNIGSPGSNGAAGRVFGGYRQRRGPEQRRPHDRTCGVDNRHGDFERGDRARFGGVALSVSSERRQSDPFRGGSAGNTTVLSGGIEIVSSAARRARVDRNGGTFEFFGGANYSNLFTGSGAIVTSVREAGASGQTLSTA